MFISLIQYILSALTIASILYYLVCIFAARRFFSTSDPDIKEPTLAPVTILIPLCGADFEAYQNYASFCRQDYPVYQIVFGVHTSEDSSVPVVRKLRRDFPEMDIELVIKDGVIGENPKVNNLFNMLGCAKYERILIADSDIRVGSDFLSKIVPYLNDDRVGLVTCFYRGGQALNLASRLEFLGISSEFAPGVLVARLMGGMSFALGATMATTRRKLEAIGGFRAVSDYLADDYMLGHLLWRAGHEIRLSPYVVETMQPEVGFVSMIKHQIRWSRGIRACRPMGHFGSLITHGTTLALFSAIAHGASLSSMLVLGLTLAARSVMAWYVGVRCLGDGILKAHFYLLPLRDILSFSVWCMSVVGRRVEWRGKPYRIVEDGKIKPLF